jgi:hypothetical protein
VIVLTNICCHTRHSFHSGAGNGQTLSLIVALGDFTGGQIVVEDEAFDIRYKPLEFDGWKQRHATLPFIGERYSLVWFTPWGVSEEDYWWFHPTNPEPPPFALNNSGGEDSKTHATSKIPGRDMYS